MSEIYALSSIREYENDGDRDYEYIPGRGFMLAAGRRERGLVALPETEGLRLFAGQMEEILEEMNVAAPEAVFFPNDHYLLDVTIREHLDILKARLRLGELHKVFPYANTDALRDWVNDLRYQGYRIDVHMAPRVYSESLRHPQHRGGWGRWVDRPDEPSFPERWGISYPKSWIGTTLSETMEAYQRLTEETGSAEAFFKPIFSSGGFTLAPVSSIEEVETHYRRLAEKGVLTLFDAPVPVELQEGLSIRGLYSVQYAGTMNIAPNGLTKQIEHKNKWAGNIFNSNHVPPEIYGQAAENFRRFVWGYERETGQTLSGYGGLDMAAVDDGEQQSLYVLEHNGGREVGARPGIAFAEIFGLMDRPFMLRKIPASLGSDLRTFWHLLQREGLAFDPASREGVFPLLFLEDNSFLFEVNPDENAIGRMSDEAIQAGIRRGYLLTGT